MITQSERRSATTSAILASARRLFAAAGFAETSVDAIAFEAGIAKGAVYHHFSSKEAILDRVVDVLQGEIAIEVRQVARSRKDLADGLARGTFAYLIAATAPGVRRILFFDGPAVLGWERWRVIDQAHFSPLIHGVLEAGLRERFEPRKVQAIGHLVAGAMLEAALVCATAENPENIAREMTEALIIMLTPLLSSQGAP